MGRQMVVACDDGLSRLRPILEEAGYAVRSLHDASLERVDAILLSGIDSDVTGRSERLSPALVVHVAGMTPADVIAHLQARLGVPER